MPVINFSYSDLCHLMGAEVARDTIRERLPMMGADMKSVPDDGDELSFEFFPDRPDLYSVEGVARAFSDFLDGGRAPKAYEVGESDVEVRVDPSVNEVRPHIWSALVEGITVDDPFIRSMMDLQEKLHITLGRNRKKVAIGIHDFDAVRPPFTYKAVLPDEVSFVPLQATESMTPGEVLVKHEKGRAFAHVLEGKARYPLIVDADGEVLSMPPIINGIATAVTERTTRIFVDCTGTDLNAVQSTVNILCAALADRGGTIRAVRIVSDGSSVPAPDMGPRRMKLEHAYVNRLLGTNLTPEQMAACLSRMGHGVGAPASTMEVLVPCYRPDIIHQADLAEDVAIGHGYEHFGGSMPREATLGSEDPMVAFAEAVRPVLIGLGYFEVVTLSLSNARDQFEAMGLDPESLAVRVANPVSEDNTLIRVSLVPSLLSILRKNRHRELPQRVFEVGDVVVDAVNVTRLAGVSIHPRASFTECKSVVQSLAESLGVPVEVAPHSSPSFIEGRSALLVADGVPVGVFGEMSPSTITSFDLGYPVVAFELDLALIRGRMADRTSC